MPSTTGTPDPWMQAHHEQQAAAAAAPPPPEGHDGAEVNPPPGIAEQVYHDHDGGIEINADGEPIQLGTASTVVVVIQYLPKHSFLTLTISQFCNARSDLKHATSAQWSGDLRSDVC